MPRLNRRAIFLVVDNTDCAATVRHDQQGTADHDTTIRWTGARATTTLGAFAPPSAPDRQRRGKLLDTSSTLDGVAVGGSEAIESSLDLPHRADLRGPKLDEPTDGRIGNPSLAGDLPHGMPTALDATAELLSRDCDALHDGDLNVRFIERSSVQMSVRAKNRSVGYLRLMPKPFTHVVEELKEAVGGSFDRLEAYFGGRPVKSTWSKWAKGLDDGPGPGHTKKICKQLGCTVAQLRGEVDWDDGFLKRLAKKAEQKLGKAKRTPKSRQLERERELVESMLSGINQIASSMRDLLRSIDQRASENAQGEHADA